MKTEGSEALGRQRAKPSKIKARYSRPICKNCSYLHTILSHTRQILLIFPFLQTHITSQMWPCGGKGEN